MIDGLAYGALPADVIARVRASIVALVHHPLCLEAGLTKARQDALYILEKDALALARRIIVTSGVTARTLVSDFAVPDGKITIAEPGTDPAPRAEGSSAARSSCSASARSCRARRATSSCARWLR